jgi:hypothetical protein
MDFMATPESPLSTRDRDLARATGILPTVLHAIAKEKIVIPDWIAKLASAHGAEWVLVIPLRPRRRHA